MTIDRLTKLNAQLREEITQHGLSHDVQEGVIGQQAALAEISTLALSTVDIGHLMQEAVRCVANVLSTEHATIIELLPNREVLLHAATGWELNQSGRGVVESEEDWRTSDRPETAAPVTVQQFIYTPAPHALARQGIVTSIHAVIPGNSEPYGLLSAHLTAHRSFTEKETLFLQSVASLLAIAIKRHNLDEKLQSISTELARSNGELQQFAYVAAHDLQEPLRAVVSYLDLLQEHLGDNLDEKARKYVNNAVGGGKRMSSLIEDLLNYALLETGNRVRLPIESELTVTRALLDLKLRLDEADAEVTLSGLPLVVADPSQLRQLFQNLIENAIKFRGSNRPQISISAKREGANWLFSVKDNGIGMDMQFADRIFLIFQRLHARAEYKGSGIGLAICKKIVERHGGQIWVESTPGQGATMLFTIPFVDQKKERLYDKVSANTTG